MRNVDRNAFDKCLLSLEYVLLEKQQFRISKLQPPEFQIFTILLYQKV